jgi:hypothetical protein
MFYHFSCLILYSLGKFPPEVYAAFPQMLRKLSMIYASLCILGSLFVSEPKEVGDKKAVAPAIGVDIMEALKTPQFYLIWMMIFSSASAGLNVASVYKQFAAIKPALTGKYSICSIHISTV